MAQEPTIAAASELRSLRRHGFCGLWLLDSGKVGMTSGDVDWRQDAVFLNAPAP